MTRREDEERYTLVAGGPPVAAEEVESHERAVEVMVLWGDQVLQVTHLPAGAGFVAGTDEAGGAPDWLVGREALGVDRLPLVVAAPAGPAIVVPAQATGCVRVGASARSLDALREAGLLVPSAHAQGAAEYALPKDATAELAVGDFTFVVRPVAAGKRVGMGLSSILEAAETRPLPYLGASVALAGLVATIFYLLPPTAAGLSLDHIDPTSRLADIFHASQEVVPDDAPTWLASRDAAEGGQGERHAGDEGEMGDPELRRRTSGRVATEGPEHNPDPHLARERAREAATTAGVLGVLRNLSGSWQSPTSEFGRAQALGTDPMSALGGIMGDHLGADAGWGGLGMHGTGRGAGGTGQGTYGLGSFGTLGHGGGTGDGQGYGPGDGVPMRAHRSRGPVLRPLPPEVVGSLSKEVIRRVVHRHRNEVRHCYEQELSQQPDLEGRVTVHFLIAPSGAVQTSGVVPASTSMQSAGVQTCVATAVRRWSFPAPDNGGVVSVSYPFLFSSGQ